jgi:hypothetical protein
MNEKIEQAGVELSGIDLAGVDPLWNLGVAIW